MTLELLPWKESRNGAACGRPALPQVVGVTVPARGQGAPSGAYSRRGPTHPAHFPGSSALLLLGLQGFHLHPGHGISLVLVCMTL